MPRPWIVVMSVAVLAALAGLPGRTQQGPAPGSYPYVEELPQVLSRTAPEYPAAARDAGVEGQVIVTAHVDRTGRVVEARVLKSVHMLDAAAIACVRRWRFTPARSGGEPVEVWVGVPVTFALHGAGAPPGLSPGPLRFRADGDTAWKTEHRLANRYYVDSNSAEVVNVTTVDSEHVRLECPGQWDGSGEFRGTTYRGVFAWRADARNRAYRGVRGTHVGILGPPPGQLFVWSKFTNRAWPQAQATWTPLPSSGEPPAGVAFRGGRTLPDNEIMLLPPRSSIQHPVWPPQVGPGERDLEHPVWPPEKSKANGRILPAIGSVVDSSRR